MTESDIINGIIEREGGYSDRAADRGGPTNMGITIPTLSDWRGRRATAEDIRSLARSEAYSIYRHIFVRPWVWVPDPDLQVLLIDWSVTSWNKVPTKALQRAVGAEPDGVVGPETINKTMDALNINSHEVYRSVLRERTLFYVRIALSDPPVVMLMKKNDSLQLHNLKGWIARCMEFA